MRHREIQEYQWDIPDAFRMDEVRSGHNWQRRREIRAKVGYIPTFAVMATEYGASCVIILTWTRADQIGPED